MFSPSTTPRQLILAFRPFDFSDDSNNVPLEQSKRLVSTLCSSGLSQQVSPTTTSDVADFRFRTDSIRIPMTMKTLDIQGEPSSTPWIQRQKALAKLNGNVSIHAGFWQAAMDIIKDYRFRASLEHALLEKNPSTGKLRWKVDEVFVTGFSLGAGLGHIVAYLLRTMFLPFFARLVEQDYVNHFGFQPLGSYYKRMPIIRITTFGSFALLSFFPATHACLFVRTSLYPNRSVLIYILYTTSL